LNHPHICQIFDIGDDYLVLEYVEGKPLSSSLPEQESVRLAIQIASALEEAHQHGIIHRDLKPSNIMVTDKGGVKLLDFGLAKLYEENASISTLPTVDMPATQAGAILGTVAYMSPEQAQGELADARSDIFSFGLVLYETLSGRRAFSGNSASETIAALLRDEPTPLKASAQLEKIVKRCLEKQPADRYQTMAEIKAALEKVSTEKVVGSSTESQPSIAVLPFVNMSGDREQEYFSDGLAEEVINALTKIPGLKVTARTSAFAFRGKEQDITKIAEALRVKTILEGSVRKAGNRVRISAQLINAADGYHLWSERYDRDMSDVFAIQDEISQAIAEKLRIELKSGHRLVKQGTENVEAHNLCLKGRYHFLKLTPDSGEKSREYFEQAIALDPNYAEAWFGMALFYWWQGYSGTMLPTEAQAQFENALLTALKLDETLPEAHSALGVSHAMRFDWEAAEREFQRALELNPDAWEALLHYATWYLTPLGRLDEAAVALRRALDIDPLSAVLQRSLGMVYFAMRQFDRAIEQFTNTLELHPHYYLIDILMGISYFCMEKPDEGKRAIKAAERINEQRPIAQGLLGFAYARADRIGDAKSIMVKLQEQARNGYVPALALAFIHQGLGETSKAFEYFEKAVEEMNGYFLETHASPIFESLRSHPQYPALLHKMNLQL